MRFLQRGLPENVFEIAPNQTTPETKELTEGFLKNFDEKLASTELKATVFSSKKVKYSHQPVVITIAEDVGGNKHPHMKIKLLAEYLAGII